MTKEEMREKELAELAAYFNPRYEAIVTSYKQTHKLPSRGVIDTPELSALRKEEIQRLGEIIEKYKD